MNIKLTLIAKGDPKKLKGLKSVVGAIVDADGNVICLVPLSKLEWVHECLVTKLKTDSLFKRLSMQEQAS